MKRLDEKLTILDKNSADRSEAIIRLLTQHERNARDRNYK
jgi:hypothetical protein